MTERPSSELTAGSAYTRSRKTPTQLANQDRVANDPVALDDGDQILTAPGAAILVGLALLQRNCDQLLACDGPCGVQLGGAQSPAPIAHGMARLLQVALDFLRFADLRPYI